MDNFTKSLVGLAFVVGVGLLIVWFLTVSRFMLNQEPVMVTSTGSQSNGFGPEGLGRSGPGQEKNLPLPPKPELKVDVTGYRLSPSSPFYDLTNEERNKIWWEIAGVGQRKRDEEMAFTIHPEQVNALARKYNCTTIEIFEFFRAGKNSDWVKFDDVE
jgi:hypothetical protein